MKNILKSILLFLAVLLAAACASSSSITHHSSLITLDKEQVWQLVQIQGREIDRSATPVTLIFNPETNTLRGQAACNTYSADYTIGNSTIENNKFQFTILNSQSSNIQCPETEMNAEARYLATLRKCTLLSATSTTLTLGNKNKDLLIFELQ